MYTQDSRSHDSQGTQVVRLSVICDPADMRLDRAVSDFRAVLLTFGGNL